MLTCLHRVIGYQGIPYAEIPNRCGNPKWPNSIWNQSKCSIPSLHVGYDRLLLPVKRLLFANWSLNLPPVEKSGDLTSKNVSEGSPQNTLGDISILSPCFVHPSFFFSSRPASTPLSKCQRDVLWDQSPAFQFQCCPWFTEFVVKDYCKSRRILESFMWIWIYSVCTVCTQHTQ